MGLDAYGKVRSPKGEVKEIAYWRKHNALHGWMEKLYRKKGGTEEFNCVPLELVEADLEMLELVVASAKLPETGGFFFGSDSRFCGHYKEQTLQFIEEAREYLSRGWAVAYDSWW
jgi:hypothetical protein